MESDKANSLDGDRGRDLTRSPLASTDIKFYAIRQKSTGYFLPHHYGSKRAGTISFTYDEPQPNILPRPFKTAAAARIALTAWLKGIWKREGFKPLHGDEASYLPEPPSSPPLYRHAWDMEVVEIRLGSIRPVI